jgi:hypothetical protein
MGSKRGKEDKLDLATGRSSSNQQGLLFKKNFFLQFKKIIKYENVGQEKNPTT